MNLLTSLHLKYFLSPSWLLKFNMSGKPSVSLFISPLLLVNIMWQTLLNRVACDTAVLAHPRWFCPLGSHHYTDSWTGGDNKLRLTRDVAKNALWLMLRSKLANVWVQNLNSSLHWDCTISFLKAILRLHRQKTPHGSRIFPPFSFPPALHTE